MRWPINILTMIMMLTLLLLAGCGQGKTVVRNVVPVTQSTAPIECGTDAECYAAAEVKCQSAKAVLEDDETGEILNVEVRGIIEGRCNEYLVAKAPDDLAGLDAVCEIPLGLEMKGLADICKYCEGQLIDIQCDESEN